MPKIKFLSLIFLILIGGQTSFANCNESSFITGIDAYLNNPEYKVLFLGRHGKASQKNKSTAAEKKDNLELQRLDKLRPLKKSGSDAAMELSEILSQLSFRNVRMWGSDALRVRQTAEPTYMNINAQNKEMTFGSDLYYANVEAVMKERLTRPENANVDHAFFWGHGKTTNALFKKLSGAEEVFNPTAGMMVVAIKAKTWREFFENQNVEAHIFAWSPKGSHVIKMENAYAESALESLESVPALESFSLPQNDQYVEITKSNFSW